MSKIDKSLAILSRVSDGDTTASMFVDPRSLLLVTLIFLCMLLSLPAIHIDILLWFAIYPIISAPMFGMRYSSVFLQSLIILPLVLLLGIFNPIIDKTQIASYHGIYITRGWLLFIGIIIRGLLSMQALLILIRSIGFVGIAKALGRLGVPKFLIVQLMMIFRYIRVLIEEGVSMKTARESRGSVSKHLSMKMWSVLIGQLFLRSISRAERIHKAMVARGFNGEMVFLYQNENIWGWSSTIFLLSWSFIFICLRLFNLSLLFV